MSDTIRGYRLCDGDVFSISADTFFTNSIFWHNPYHIMGIDRVKVPIYLWHIKLPFIKRNVTMLQIMYINPDEKANASDYQCIFDNGEIPPFDERHDYTNDIFMMKRYMKDNAYNICGVIKND